MRRIGLNIQTLFADLAQGASGEDVRAASVQTKTVKGRKYLYVQEKLGTAFRHRGLGPQGDPAAEREAVALREAGARARERRKLVTLIKSAGVSAPGGDLARILEAISAAGLFGKGVVLIGTDAYQIYPRVVGAFLGSAALTTRDIDLAVATLAISHEASLLDILRQADVSFRAAPGLRAKDAPKRFRAGSGFEVELVTPVRTRRDKDPSLVPGLAAGTTPLQFLNFLIADALETVALIGSGIPVTVPQPARYAVHKLIIAQATDRPPQKRIKDLAQARELMEALRLSNPWALDDAFSTARATGAKWRVAINRSMKEIERA